MDTETIGKEDWEELQRNLEATIPVYDKVNRVATFGQVTKWRQMVRERLPEEEFSKLGVAQVVSLRMLKGMIWFALTQFLKCLELLKKG